MKNKKVEYTVYPPKYIPGVSYKTVDTKKKAFRLAVKFGTGAEIVVWRSKRGSFWTDVTWTVVHDKYLVETLRNNKYVSADDTTTRIRDVNGKYAPIFRLWKGYKLYGF